MFDPYRRLTITFNANPKEEPMPSHNELLRRLAPEINAARVAVLGAQSAVQPAHLIARMPMHNWAEIKRTSEALADALSDAQDRLPDAKE